MQVDILSSCVLLFVFWLRIICGLLNFICGKTCKAICPWMEEKIQYVLLRFVTLQIYSCALTMIRWCGFYRLAYPYDFGIRLTSCKAILFPYDGCKIPYESADLWIFKIFLVLVRHFMGALYIIGGFGISGIKKIWSKNELSMYSCMSKFW